MELLNSNTDLIKRYLNKTNHISNIDNKVKTIINKIDQKLTTSLTACDSILSIVDSLRVFARLDEAEYQLTTISSLIDNTLAIMKNKLKAGIKINKIYNYSLPILCFPSQMNQVFMNIINNAYDVMNGRGAIDISLDATDKVVKIIFHDTGPGISENILPKIFNPGCMMWEKLAFPLKFCKKMAN
ncbi:MAG: HAMP domain-containing sensor histidine kinase [Thermodesulfobacteriota bacterium]|nr:HAMP domain-containing sensor histidine kinase [Thermodesulfobacteriota bacterium]